MTDLITALGTLVSGIALILLIRQNRIAQEASNSQNVLSLINFLLSEENRQARTHVWKNLKNKDYKKWNQKDIEQADRVCASYTSAATLIKRSYASKEFFLDEWGTSITSAFEILRPHLRERQKTAGARYWSAFEWLYNEVVSYESKLKIKQTR
ncbi:MAG: hypothetical protein KIS73_02425 [Enhydrobacter sp.]|nr:hypothetical protein [Enhydrobacter sp.]